MEPLEAIPVPWAQVRYGFYAAWEIASNAQGRTDLGRRHETAALGSCQYLSIVELY